MSQASDNVLLQERDVRATAAVCGYELADADIFVDNGRSAWRSSRPRPGFRAMLAAVEAGGVAALLVYNTDRLSRWGTTALTLLEALRRHEVKVIQADGEERRPLTADGYYALQVQFAAAEHQSSRASERLRRKHREIAEEGRPPGGGRRSLGYSWDPAAKTLVVVPEEAVIIQEAAGRILSGWPLAAVCRDMNERGIAPPGGGRWRRSSLRGLLRSARVSGQRELRLRGPDGTRSADGPLTPGTWERILSPAQTLQLRAEFDGRAGRRQRARPRLLSGVLRCGRCGGTLRWTRHHDRHGVPRYEVYACMPDAGSGSRCAGVTVAAPWAEAWVTEAVLIALDTPEMRAELLARAKSDEGSALLVRLQNYRDRRDELAAAVDDDKPLAVFLSRGRALEARIVELERRLAGLRRRDILTGLDPDARAAWQFLDHERRRRVIREVVDSVTVAAVGRAKQGRLERLSVAWRF
jgi:DNA invertase Pin-like site-specific DNA recombinase